MRFKPTWILATVISLSTLTTSSLAQPYNDCGDAPIEPKIEDGSSASMEELISTSAKVNAFIEEADIFLDCQEALYKKGVQAGETKERLAELVKTLTTRRNEIGDEFNEQVAAFKAANP